MLHMIAFSASTATSSALTNVAGVADPSVTVSGNYIYLSALTNIVAAYALGTNLLTAELQAPSLRRVANLDLSPVDTGATPTARVGYKPRYQSPNKLDKDEGLQALVTTGSSAVSNVLVQLSDGAVAPVSGDIVTVKVTFTAPTGNYSWNNAALTFGQTLPVGSYDCVGARFEGTGLIALRFVPVGQVNRPGVICVTDSKQKDPEGQRYGEPGVLFTFDQLTPPTVDVFHDGASGTITGYLDIIKK